MPATVKATPTVVVDSPASLAAESLTLDELEDEWLDELEEDDDPVDSSMNSKRRSWNSTTKPMRTRKQTRMRTNGGARTRRAPCAGR